MTRADRIQSFSQENEDAASGLLALCRFKSPEACLSSEFKKEYKEQINPISTESTNQFESKRERPAQIISDDDSPSSKADRKKLSFPETLMKLLTDPVFEDMLTFLPDDNTFTILRPKIFSSLLLPRFFSMRKLPTFVSKLGRFGFKHVTNGLCDGFPAFRHPLFRKNDWDLCKKIKMQSRTKAQELKQPKLSTPKSNFYSNLLEDVISQESTVQMGQEQNMSTIDRQRALQAQLRALQQEESQLTAKKRERRLSLQTSEVSSKGQFSDATRDNVGADRRHSFDSSELSSTDEVIEATKDIVGAAIDCLLVDEDHTRSLLSRYSLQQSPNTILPQGFLTQDQFPTRTSFTHSIHDRIREQLDVSNELSRLDQVDEQLSLLALRKQLQLSELDALLRYS